MPKVGDHKQGTKTSSFISGISKVELSVAPMRSDIEYCIKNPLVVMMGIGDYDNDVMPPLVGVTRDYLNMIYLFYCQFGYSFAF